MGEDEEDFKQGRFFKWQKCAEPFNLWPMRLLDRYLFRELLSPLAYCLIGIQSFVIFNTVFTDAGKIQEAKLHFLGTIEYAAAASMTNTTIVLPMSLLLALLMALTQHARYNELTAMRAAGIGLWRICVPYFIVGLLATGALFVLNEQVVPRSTDWSLHLLGRDLMSTHATGKSDQLNFVNEREGRKWMVRDYRMATGEMLGVIVDWTLPSGQEYIYQAERAVHTNGVWTFFNVQEYFQTNGMPAPVPTVRTNVLEMPEFDETTREIRAEIKIGSYLNYGAINPNIPLKDIRAFLRRHPDLSRGDQGRLLTEMQERLASPFTCLVVVLIAIPFGAVPGRRNLFVGVAGSIFICFAYFVLQRISLAFGSNGTWPAWLAAWLPNLVFGLLGLVLTARIR